MGKQQAEVRKYKAIEKLVRNGSRGSEWHEAGLLDAIAQVVAAPDDVEFTSEKLKEMMEKAKRY